MSSKFGGGAATLKESASGGASFDRTHFLSIKDGEQEIVRFMTDYEAQQGAPHILPWLSIRQHSNVPTIQEPSWHGLDADGNKRKEPKKWPSRMGVVCRNTICEGIPGRPKLWEVLDDGLEGCLVCDGDFDAKTKRASTRGWALACLREEVRDESGSVLGYRDKLREVERDGVTVTEKAVVLVNNGWKNFFSKLEGFGLHYGTILDRDFIIRRSGSGISTDYNFFPIDPVPTQDGRAYDLRDPEIFARYETNVSLDDEIDRQGSADWQRRWFDPTWSPQSSKDSGPTQSESSPAQPASPQGVTEASLADMAARVKNYAPATTTPQDDAGDNPGASGGKVAFID